MQLKRRTIVTECVTCAHPDKMADVISDTILDYAVKQEPNTRAGIEVLIKDNTVVIGGEIKTNARLDYPNIVREVLSSYKFPKSHKLGPDDIKVVVLIGEQSPEINAGVDQKDGIIGAGDQGFCVGYAAQTETRLPLGMQYTREICNRLTDLHLTSHPEIGPDGKSQVVIEHDYYGKPTVKSILVSVMHSEEINVEKVREIVTNEVKDILNNDIDFKQDVDTVEIIVNPCGSWHIGGPVADCGLTGRKIVVDQFGGYANAGGGAFSGKDLSKVDRSAAYLARFLANILIEAGLGVEEAHVELSYMISVPEPSSFEVAIVGGDVWGELEKFSREWFQKHIDMTPSGIMKLFGHYICFSDLARYGHYGVGIGCNVYRPWEDNKLIKKYSVPLQKDFLEYMNKSE